MLWYWELFIMVKKILKVELWTLMEPSFYYWPICRFPICLLWSMYFAWNYRFFWGNISMECIGPTCISYANKLPNFHSSSSHRKSLIFILWSLVLIIFAIFRILFVSIYYYMVGMNQEFDRFLMACLIVLLVTQVCSERLRDLLEYVPLKKGSGHIPIFTIFVALHIVLLHFLVPMFGSIYYAWKTWNVTKLSLKVFEKLVKKKYLS